MEPGAGFFISSDGWPHRVHVEIAEGKLGETVGLFDVFSGAARPLTLVIRSGFQADRKEFPLAEDGSLDRYSGPMRHLTSMQPQQTPIRFVTVESLHAREMARSWNRVVQEGRESQVVETVRILQPDLTSIHFLAGDTRSSARGLGGILLGSGDGAPRVPIGRYGEGTRRLLALSLALASAAEGFLLIDEIDTGLHWSIMEDMWNLVVDAARTASIQVFATTHSLDCIVGLAGLLRKRPDLSDAVSIQRIERQLDHSVSFGTDDIVTAADLSIELR